MYISKSSKQDQEYLIMLNDGTLATYSNKYSSIEDKEIPYSNTRSISDDEMSYALSNGQKALLNLLTSSNTMPMNNLNRKSIL